MKTTKKTKIVATVGPATSSKKMLEAIIAEGVNVIRINFSHGEHSDHVDVIKRVRQINKEQQIHTALLGDLQGPKIRVGKIKEGTKVKVGDVIEFTNEEIEGDGTKAYISYKTFPKDVQKGEKILINDGKLALEIIDTDRKTTVKAKFLNGGKFS